MNHATQFRQRVKRAVVIAFGGVCNRCGYHRCIEALDLHHINKSDKEFGFGEGIKKLSRYVEEAVKCILLCSNCHREHHAGLWNIEDINLTTFNESIFWQETKGLKLRPQKICVVCKDKPARRYRQTCDDECLILLKRKVIDRPTKEMLAKLVWEIPTNKIAKSYGVSDKTIAKWCKIYLIDKPPRGYWSKPSSSSG